MLVSSHRCKAVWGLDDNHREAGKHIDSSNTPVFLRVFDIHH